MMHKGIANAVAILSLATAPLTAGAAIKVYSFNLDSMQEVPANMSSAAGSAQITVDDTLGTIEYAVVAFNLDGAFTASHIHGPAMSGVNAGVLSNLVTNAYAAPGPVMIGSFVVANSISFAGMSTDATLASAINAMPWMYYVNIHTTAYPGGEVRGQLAPVPEPETYALMLAGLGLVGFMARGRRVQTA